MKPIQLTEEHKSKLLEMCKALFPTLQHSAYEGALEFYGSKKSVEANIYGFYLTGNGHIHCSFPYDQMDDSFHTHLIESIHWFEFCMTALAEAIYGDLKEYDEGNYKEVDYFRGFWKSYGHPLDFLYSEFKRLK